MPRTSIEPDKVRVLARPGPQFCLCSRPVEFDLVIALALTVLLIASCASAQSKPMVHTLVDAEEEQPWKRYALQPRETAGNIKFSREMEAILEQLPASARIAIPDYEVEAESTVRADPKFVKRIASMMAAHQRDLLEGSIAKLGFTVVDRSSLKKAQEEWALQHSGVVDDATMIQLGKLLGATHIMIGHCRLVLGKRFSDVLLSVRVIDIQTSRVLGVATYEEIEPNLER